MNNADNMVRVGIVSALDNDNLMVRCHYPDMDNMNSDWLYVVQRPGQSEMPAINDSVLVLYPSGWDMDGYVLGVIA